MSYVILYISYMTRLNAAYEKNDTNKI